MNRHLSEDDQYFAVELQRGMKGFGFSIRGGREFHSMPLFVLRMAVDGKCLTETERLTINHTRAATSINCQQLGNDPVLRSYTRARICNRSLKSW